MTESFIKSSFSLNEFSNREFEWFAWSSPSNIALAKYWGKKAWQIPENPSVSFTLDKCRTKMMVISSPKGGREATLDFYFDGEKANQFGKKAFSLINKVMTDYPILADFDFQIISENTFPHSSGIASSASAMSALSLCLTELLFSLCSDSFKSRDFFQVASHYARLGSGSACRSVYGGVALWGETKEIKNSSDEYSLAIDEVHEKFLSFRDSVLIISSEQKAVSSTAGHGLMNDHPFKETRYKNAYKNCLSLIELMKSDDLWRWGEIVEREALELHGLMMNGKDSFILMKPNTLSVIEKVREFRQTKNVPIFFTLDAGPNVHLLYPEENLEVVHQFIQQELLELCENQVWFDDKVGSGPINLKKDHVNRIEKNQQEVKEC